MYEVNEIFVSNLPIKVPNHYLSIFFGWIVLKVLREILAKMKNFFRLSHLLKMV